MTNPLDLLERLRSETPAAARQALDIAVDVCRERGFPLYLVGGALRDLILGRGNVDLDLAVEGDSAVVAADVAARSGGRVVLHERFGTATVGTKDWEIDLAQTRAEEYPYPGALPVVRPAPLRQDLARRDFSINAIALRIDTPGGELIDPFGGLSDLQERRIRILHPGSFRDDATRLVRAMRYAARLQFQLEAATAERVREDRGFVSTISPMRIRRELALLFQEAIAPRATLLAQDFGILPAIHPGLRMEPDLAERWATALAGQHFASLEELGFCLTARPDNLDAVASISDRLHLVGQVEGALRDFVRLMSQFDKLAAASDVPFAAVELLEGRSPAAVWALSIADVGRCGQACRRYLEEWRRVRPQLNGDDLLALGVPAGQEIGRTLRMLRRARLEGRAPNREDEVRLVRQELGS